LIKAVFETSIEALRKFRKIIDLCPDKREKFLHTYIHKYIHYSTKKM